MSLHTAVKGQFGLGTGRAPGKALKKAMFIGRHYRKKVQLLLPPVPAAPPTPSMSRWRPPLHHGQGVERNWYESVFRSHAAMCGCGDFVNHIVDLASRFGRPGNPRPPGAPQPPPIRPLPALPPPEHPGDRAPWPMAGGGDGGDAGGGDRGAADGGPVAADDEDLDALFAAADE